MFKPRWHNASRFCFFLLLALVAALNAVSCQPSAGHRQGAPPVPGPVVSQVRHPQWSHNVSIYEVNVRQYSPEGTFRGLQHHLGRLRDLGVGILWFMPIHPLGQKNRKGSLGSYYSVRDYFDVNPEFGTLEEFKALVEKIHQMGMYVIIDWVANHTAWDHSLTVDHPDWYMRNSQGQFFPPVPDWSDVIDLNYNNPALWDYMIEAMRFWVKEVDIDGFRCDVASMVPMNFWDRARAELEEIKPVFMLAEAEGPEFHHRAFDMTYNWTLYHLIKDIARGRKTAADIDAYLETERRGYPGSAYRMNFTSNHDENSWNGTVFERLGESAETFAALMTTLEGMPLIYSGQEAGLDRRLEFFEKDLIEWKDHPFTELYTILLHLKRNNRALWNGEWGGELVRVPTSNDEDLFAFVREKDSDKVFAVFNLSVREQQFVLLGQSFSGQYRDVFSSAEISFQEDATMTLAPWAYGIYVR